MTKSNKCECNQNSKKHDEHKNFNHNNEHNHEHNHSHESEHEHNHSHAHGHNHEHDHSSKESAIIITRLVLSVILLVCGFFILKISTPAGIVILVIAYLTAGYDILFEALENIFHLELMDESFLMCVASIGAFAIGEYFEAVLVMILFSLGEFLQGLAVSKSKRNITALMDLRPDYANIKVNGEIKRVSPESIKKDDIIYILPGEKIPLDGVLFEGESDVNTANLTGESIPRHVKPEDIVLSGFVNQNQEFSMRVTETFSESTASKIIELVENASERKSSSENFITSFAKVYTPIVVALAVLIVLIPTLFFKAPDLSFSENLTFWLRKGLSFLVVSCPCSLVISIPLTYFSGISGASKNGILVKGSNFLDSLSKLEKVVWDKTGTLTNGDFSVIMTTSVNPLFEEADLIKIAAHAEFYSAHPIARSVCAAYMGKIDESAISDFKVIDGKGIECLVNNQKIQIGSKKFFESVSLPDETMCGTYCYIFADDVFLGYMVIADTLKENSKKALSDLKDLGVGENIMLTGDSSEVAESVSKDLGIDKYFASLLPVDKVQMLETILESKGKGTVAFVGDGMNDAPVLRRADIGIAMGGLGSDAAIEAADVVLMNDSPDRLPLAIKLAKKVKKIAKENIVISLAVKVLVLILIVFGLSNMYMAVFADVGVCLLCILNSARALNAKIQ